MSDGERKTASRLCSGGKLLAEMVLLRRHHKARICTGKKLITFLPSSADEVTCFGKAVRFERGTRAHRACSRLRDGASSQADACRGKQARPEPGSHTLTGHARRIFRLVLGLSQHSEVFIRRFEFFWLFRTCWSSSGHGETLQSKQRPLPQTTTLRFDNRIAS